MRIGIISQARMGSTRLPGKVLLTAAGRSMLHYHAKRLQASSLPLYIATTTLPEDEVIVRAAEQLGVPCFRGSSDDVLSRYYNTARHFELDVVVRVTSDCPLIDGALIRAGVAQYRAANNLNLYLSNGIERTFPRGLDFEIFSFELLAQAQRHAVSPSDREHVTPYLHQNRGGNVVITQLTRQPDASRFRITLDTPEDFTLLKTLLEDYQADQLTADQLIALLEQHPELTALNAAVEQQKYDFTR